MYICMKKYVLEIIEMKYIYINIIHTYKGPPSFQQGRVTPHIEWCGNLPPWLSPDRLFLPRFSQVREVRLPSSGGMLPDRTAHTYIHTYITMVMRWRDVESCCMYVCTYVCIGCSGENEGLISMGDGWIRSYRIIHCKIGLFGWLPPMRHPRWPHRSCPPAGSRPPSCPFSSTALPRRPGRAVREWLAAPAAGPQTASPTLT